MAVSAPACGPEDLGSNPVLPKVRNVAIFFLRVFMIQSYLIKQNLIGEGTSIDENLREKISNVFIRLQNTFILM